jgi:hypothetical protein
MKLEEREKLFILLARWVNIAENGQYGDRTKFPLKNHPIVSESRAALKDATP